MDNVTSLFPAQGQRHRAAQVVFDRHELSAILNIYGKMVAAGQWRDYAIDLGRDAAMFSAFKRAAEQPDMQIVKRPALARKQGAYALLGAQGSVLKRGHDLAGVLQVINRKLIKLVDRD